MYYNHVYPGNCQRSYGHKLPKQLKLFKIGIPILLFALGMYN